MAKIKQDKIYTIRAYCSRCGKFLMESVKLTKKELMINWDKGIFDAPGISCDDCKTPIPNFYLDIKIHNAATGKDYDPKFVMPKANIKLDSLADLLT